MIFELQVKGRVLTVEEMLSEIERFHSERPDYEGTAGEYWHCRSCGHASAQAAEPAVVREGLLAHLETCNFWNFGAASGSTHACAPGDDYALHLELSGDWICEWREVPTPPPGMMAGFPSRTT